AEQTAEVAEVEAAWGRRPVEWLLSNHAVDKNWCLIHATQTLAGEIAMMAQSGAVVGLCPITESNLGDGIFDAVSLAGEGGVFGVGSDSNVQISLPAELRTLEYSQRLHRHGRAMLATEQASTGRVLFDNAIKGGAQAVGRTSGAIAPGLLADLVALDADGIDLFDKTDDAILDSWIFATTENIVSQVWSAGRHVVVDGQHKARPHIARRYRKTLQDLKGRL
ncbi:MAG: amidohydrolase family protein, partial [Hyphomicrobiaceae bacterium]